jgi:hypothetical protein
MSDGTISSAGIASFNGQNALFGPGAVAACIAGGFPAAQCNAIQNTFLAPAGAAGGSKDAVTGDQVDFTLVNGNLKKNASRGAPFAKFDASMHKTFNMPKAENVKLDFRFDAFNVFNHTNYTTFINNDATNFMRASASGGIVKPDFFTCTSCMRPNGTFAGSDGRILHLADLQHGTVSKDLLDPIFNGLGDPGGADIPRTLQLSFHVRF